MKKLVLAVSLAALAACGKPADRPKTAKVGAPAPELNLTEVVRGGLKAPVKWADLKGKAVVLEFWGTGCEPCVENIPHLNELALKFKDKPVVFLSAAVDKRAAVEDFLKDHEMDSVVISDTPMELFRAFKGHGIPHTVLVDPKGVVAAFSYPSMVTEKTVEDLLAGRRVGGIERSGEDEEESGTGAEASGKESADDALAYFSIGEPGKKMKLSYGGEDFSADGVSLDYIIGTALRAEHGVEYENVPDSVKSAKFRVEAKVARVAGADTVRRLEELFVSGVNGALPVKISLVKRTRKVYLLEKDGAPKPGLKVSSGKAGGRSGTSGRDEASVDVKSGDMATLAEVLEDWLGEPVLDETGLKGRYDYKLEVKGLKPASVSAALSAGLGLKLVEARREVGIALVKGVKAKKS